MHSGGGVPIVAYRINLPNTYRMHLNAFDLELLPLLRRQVFSFKKAFLRTHRGALVHEPLPLELSTSDSVRAWMR